MEQVLAGIANARKIQDYVEYLTFRDGEYAHEAIRRTLSRLGINMCAEILSGRSYHAYRALDVYRSFWATGMH